MKLLIVILLGIAPFYTYAQPKDDSVTSRIWRGNSKIENQIRTEEYQYILKGVDMISSSVDDHVLYGPFMNNSSATLEITLLHTNNNPGWSEYSAWVGDRKLLTTQARLQFQVPPGESYSFSAKDQTSITARVNKKIDDPTLVGLPTMFQFHSPTGNLYECLQLVRYEPDYLEMPLYIYIYEAKSMSDRSVRKDPYNAANPDLTRGTRAPNLPASCRKVDYENYTYFLKM